MRILFFCLACLMLAGCITAAHKKSFQQEIDSLKTAITQKDDQIARLNDKLKQAQEFSAKKDAELKEKDEKIEDLKNKLKSFGVF